VAAWGDELVQADQPAGKLGDEADEGQAVTKYRALSGRQFDLATLSAEERAVLDEFRSLYAQRPSWDAFARRWVAIARERLWNREQIPVGSPLYRIGQDLELRLGIAEGRVAPPDYRDCSRT